MEEKEEEGNGLGHMITVALILVCIVIGLVVYNVASGPYRTADQLRERLDDKVNVSEEYRQGWLDCVKYYLEVAIGPNNMTAIISP
jgi:hypothetical protein